MLSALADVVAHRWADLEVALPPPVAMIVAGVDRSPEAKVTVLFLGPGGRALAVAKVARDESGDRALLRESEALTSIHALGAPIIASSTPRPLLVERIGERVALLETAVPGRPMTVRYFRPGHVRRRDRVAADFAGAHRWLEQLHTQTAGAMADLEEHALATMETLLPKYRSLVGWSPEEDLLFAAVRRRSSTLRGVKVRKVTVHGDYWMGNLLVDGPRVASVVDWECGRPQGAPFRDLYKFPLSYAFYLDRMASGRSCKVRGHPGREDPLGRWRRYGDWRNLPGFGYAFFGRGWFQDLAKTFILGPLQRMDVPSDVNGVFFPLFLVEQALTLRDVTSRHGYRSTVRAFARERASTWLWNARGEAIRPAPSATSEHAKLRR